MAGKLLLLIFACWPGIVLAQSNSIQITAESIDNEVLLREEALLRPLTGMERQAMVKNMIFDEVLLNEALKLNLHLTDSEVRNRLIGIMEYTYQPRIPKPSEEDLVKYFTENQSDFNLPAQFSFDHLYFKYKPEMTPEELDGIKEWQELDDEYWVKTRITEKPISEINVFLGNEVAKALENSNINQWTGPLRSVAGYHFVRVTGYKEEIPRTYDEVTDLVPEFWLENKRQEMFEERMIMLLNDYVVELPNEYKNILTN